MSSKSTSKFVLLTILDGWGIAPETRGNAIKMANTPNYDSFMENYPHTQLKAAGQAVGLPRGEDGNTETGHLNIGAGRIVYQDLERINMSIAEGDFFTNQAFMKAIEHVKSNGSDLHYMGLVGAGGVHSDLSHLFALIRLASKHEIENLYIHVFTDGRDSPPTSASTYINKLQEVLQNEGRGKIASIMGRYWAMDRDLRWDRTKRAYNTLTIGEGARHEDLDEAIESSYDSGRTDEFIEPAVITEDGEPVGLIKDNDAVIFFNFRIDRPRQLTKAFVMDDFTKAGSKLDFDPYRIRYEKRHTYSEPESQKPFERDRKINNLCFVTMTEFSKLITDEGAMPAYPPEIVQNTLGEIISKQGSKQLRITESEKERFVTYHFNGFQEKKFAGEQRIIIPSPDVSTYDLKPEMSSEELTDSVIKEIEGSDHKLIVLNFPNPDMVAHTGNIDATVSAIEAVDTALGKLYKTVSEHNGIMIITADHGNAEELIDLETDEVETEHSSSEVPFILVDEEHKGKDSEAIPSGILADIAPTILALMNIAKPEQMTGRDLIRKLD